eukprot:295828-Pelagomonas_calceolata.AAC.4
MTWRPDKARARASFFSERPVCSPSGSVCLVDARYAVDVSAVNQQNKSRARASFLSQRPVRSPIGSASLVDAWYAVGVRGQVGHVLIVLQVLLAKLCIDEGKVVGVAGAAAQACVMAVQHKRDNGKTQSALRLAETVTGEKCIHLEVAELGTSWSWYPTTDELHGGHGSTRMQQ